jgi:murein DD-endopeptidase MepM/ murein hydrolase activator NlpD
MMGNMKAIIAPMALCLPMLLGGCTTPTPYTQLDWGLNESYPYHHRKVAVRDYHPPRARARTYIYRDRNDTVTRSAIASITPTPRPTPQRVRAREVVQDTSYSAARPDAGAPRFAWPVSGRIISDFGTTQNGARNDGINIATRLDEPIHAAAAGTVTYEGNELKDYGNLILIRHANGYVTAYAHAATISVRRGDVVAQGQVIGTVGETGDVSTPQLHFEIRHDTAPVNPKPLLVASR